MSVSASTIIELPIVEPAALPLRGWMAFEIGSLLIVAACGVGIYASVPNDPLPLYIAAASLAFGISLPLFLLRVIRRYRVFIAGEQLVIRTAVGTRRLPIARLRAHGMQIIDLERCREYEPGAKRWSATMAGLQTGLFALSNGERAILVVTDRRHVCRLRSDADDLTVLLSLKNPEPLRALIGA